MSLATRIDTQTPERSWEPERVQLCLQGLLLQDAGYTCTEGVPGQQAELGYQVSGEGEPLIVERLRIDRDVRPERRAARGSPLWSDPIRRTHGLGNRC